MVRNSQGMHLHQRDGPADTARFSAFGDLAALRQAGSVPEKPPVCEVKQNSSASTVNSTDPATSESADPTDGPVSEICVNSVGDVAVNPAAAVGSAASASGGGGDDGDDFARDAIIHAASQPPPTSAAAALDLASGETNNTNGKVARAGEGDADKESANRAGKRARPDETETESPQKRRLQRQS